MIVALLPRGSSGEVHHTLVYAGEGDDPNIASILALQARWVARSLHSVTALVVAHETFGEAEETVEVAVLDGPELHAARSTMAEYAFGSQYGYNPHISVQDGYTLPAVGTIVVFDRIALWLKTKKLCWRFGTGTLCAP